MWKRSGTSEDSSSLCSIIHHLWLQNSLGSPWGYTRYPDGKTPVPPRGCLLSGLSPLRATGAYNRSLHFHAHIRAIKNKSKPEWCEPFVNVMFAGAFWNHLPNRKASFLRDWQPTFNLQADDGILAVITETICCAVRFLLFPFNQHQSLHLHSLWYNEISECSFVPA